MIEVTNKNLRHAISICGKIIKPQTKKTFDNVNMDIINYYVSTGDVEIRYVQSASNQIKQTSRKRSNKDTIIIDSDAATIDNPDREMSGEDNDKK